SVPAVCYDRINRSFLVDDERSTHLMGMAIKRRRLMDSGPRRGVTIRTYLVAMALVASLAALVAAFPQFQGLASGARPEDTGSKAVPAPRPGPAARVEVHALGQLAPEAGLINVGARPGARIDQIAVKEGDEIAGGAVVAVLEGHAQAQLQ